MFTSLKSRVDLLLILLNITILIMRYSSSVVFSTEEGTRTRSVFRHTAERQEAVTYTGRKIAESLGNVTV
jgi:hypothetical protein